ncbi:MAG TPA: TIR domain-containing protein [Pyrinomonadaceae bacterium]|jgi:predicted transcriptional regulator YheO
MIKPKVFIGSSSEKLDVANNLQILLEKGGCEVKAWKQGVFGLSDVTINTLLEKKDFFDFAVFVFAGDEKISSRGKNLSTPRDNVLLETGLFMGAIGRERTYIIRDADVKIKIPSDLDGMTLGFYKIRSDGNLQSSLDTVAKNILDEIDELGVREKPENTTKEYRGKRLFQYEGYYPIDIEEGTNLPNLNAAKFVRAMEYFLKDENKDYLAITDLIYLREDNLNHIGDILKTKKAKSLYREIIRKYKLENFVDNFYEQEKIFENYVRLVEDIGDTLEDVYLEILLHNVRNPLRSIIALRNTEKISGRKKFDPSTRFVVQFVKNQGKMLMQAMNSGSKISYYKQFNKIKKVKATTTPLYHEKYGLIAILCINIDIDAIESLKPKEKNEFFKNYIKNSGHTPEFEKDAWGVK